MTNFISSTVDRSRLDFVGGIRYTSQALNNTESEFETLRLLNNDFSNWLNKFWIITFLQS